MKRLSSAAMLAASLFATSGCFTMHAELPGALRADVEEREVQVLGELDIEVRHPFFFAGLVGEPPPNLLANEIAAQARAAGADGVRNLTVEATFEVTDLLIGCAGCGGLLVATRTYRVRGELVRIKKPPLPGAPLDPRRAPPRVTATRY